MQTSANAIGTLVINKMECLLDNKQQEGRAFQHMRIRQINR